jgi:hypothetical protein
MMPQYITIPQFIVVGSTGVANGKKTNTNKAHKKHMAPMLTYKPQRPKVCIIGQSSLSMGEFRCNIPSDRKAASRREVVSPADIQW